MADLRQQVKELRERRARGEAVPLDTGDIIDGKYYFNNVEVSPEEYARLVAQSKDATKQMMGAPVPGLEGIEDLRSRPKAPRPSMEERRRAAMSELDGMKKGGKPKMLKSKISTATKSKKSPAW